MESLTQEDQETVCYEGNGESQNHKQKECEFSDERKRNTVIFKTSVLYLLEVSFMVNMLYSFQDRYNLYLVMDLLNGGDLRYHICRYRRFSEH